MIRWKYAAPRLLVVAVLLLLIFLGLNPLLRWGIESFSEQALSLPLEIGTLDASLTKAELQIDHLAIVNPKRPDTNLVEADEVRLALDLAALLRRKFVVQEGVVRGLRLMTERAETAETIDHWQLSVDGERLRQAADRWIDTLTTSLQTQLEEEIDSLESVSLAKQLFEDWPAEYQTLEAQVRDIKVRIETLGELLHARPENLVAGLDHYQKTLAEVEQLQQMMARLAEQIDDLPDRVAADREAIAAAADRDIETLRQRFDSLELDEAMVSEYFLGPRMSDRVAAVVGWVHWVRNQMPSDQIEADDRVRGVEVLFAGQRRQPDFLIESLLFDGQAEIGGQPWAFRASATDLTNQPRIHGRPATIQAQLAGDVRVDIHAVLDRTTDSPRDHVVIDCPNLTLPATRLGRADALCLDVLPGNTHLWVELTLTDDQMAGRMLMKQSGVKMTVAASESMGGERLATALATATESIDQIEVWIDLAGSLKQPKWLLRSNLGPKLSAGLNRAALAEIEFRRNQAEFLVQDRVEKELRKLKNRLATDEEILKSRLKLSETKVQQLGKMIARQLPAAKQIPTAEQILSRALGGSNPLRF